MTAPSPTAALGPSVTIAGRRYPVLLPRVQDPRLHVAATIITIQVLGQTVLGFDVSIAQILIAIGTAAVLELGIVAATAGVIAWPASALLTGNGVALLLRTPGTQHGDWWSTQGWQIFVAAAGVSLLSKYAIRVGDRHLFNPSNFGLVVTFLVFGSRYADPQDLWWGPWRPGLVLAVVVIFVGGITLSVRLHLFPVALTFWATFGTGIALLAATGHAITARWHLGPVSGWTYWSVLVFSPEIAIFLFFMITDPKTAPEGATARWVYAAAVGVLAAVLCGLQTTEFATKVSLLAALTIVCGVRPLLERRFADRTVAPRRLVPVGLASVAAVLVAGAITPAPAGTTRPEVVARAAGARPAVDLLPGAVPPVTRDEAVRAVPGAIDAAEAQQIGRDLVEDLAIEGDALRAGDRSMAATAAYGRHLATLSRQIGRTEGGDGLVVAPLYDVRSLEVVLLQDPVSPQAVPQVGVVARGMRTDVAYEGEIIARQERHPFAQVYLVTELGGAYLIGRVLPPTTDMRVRR
ncbi:MAG: hypothetical protein U0P45_15640 [Acidimicrobiales bacterium]